MVCRYVCICVYIYIYTYTYIFVQYAHTKFHAKCSQPQTVTHTNTQATNATNTDLLIAVLTIWCYNMDGALAAQIWQFASSLETNGHLELASEDLGSGMPTPLQLIPNQ